MIIKQILPITFTCISFSFFPRGPCALIEMNEKDEGFFHSHNDGLRLLKAGFLNYFWYGL